MTPHYISAATLRRLLHAWVLGNPGLVALSDATRSRDSRVSHRHILGGVAA